MSTLNKLNGVYLEQDANMEGIDTIKNIKAKLTCIQNENNKSSNKSNNIVSHAEFRTVCLSEFERWFKLNPDENGTVIWSLFEYINYKVDKKRWKTISTLLRNINICCYELMMTAGDFKLKELTCLDWEDIYIASIDLKIDIDISDEKNRKKIQSVRGFLKQYHKFLIINAYSTPIKYSEVLNNDSILLGNSNIICKDEYELCYNQLNTLSYQNGDVFSIRAHIFTLAYRIGLRADEARCLCICELTGYTDPWICIRITYIRKGKTVNALRNIPLKPFMSEYELHQLLVYKEMRLLETKGNHNAPLFPDSTTPQNPIKDSMVFPYITSLLKYVTGDPTIRFQHLRQSFATRFSIFLTYEVGKDWEHLYKIDGIVDPSELKRVREYYFPGTVEFDPDLVEGAIYLLSTILGHSGPAISHSYYLHSNELLRYFVFKRRPANISVKAAQNILKMDKNARCKVLNANNKENKGKVKLSELNSILKEMMPFAIVPGEAQIINHFEENAFNLKISKSYPSADDLLLKISKLSKYSKNPINLSDVEEDSVWLRAMENIWLNPCNQTRLKQHRLSLCPIIPKNIRDYFDTKRIIQKLLNFISIKDNKSIASTWIYSYLSQVNKRNYEFKVANLKSAQEYLIFLQSIGISATRLHLLHYPHPDNFDDNADVYEKWSNRLGIPLEQISSRGVGNVNLSQPEGRMSVIVQTKGYKVNKSQNSRKRHATSSFLCALHICALLLEVERLK